MTVSDQSEATGLFQRTRIPHAQKDLVSDASRLLDLRGLAVDRVASDAFGGRVVSESATHYGVDWSIVHAAFVEHVKAPLAAPLPPVKVLGIDETRRGKPIWAQNPDTGRWVLVRDRWHTGFVDADGTGGLLAQVEGRSSAATIAWLNAQPEIWRAAITHVTIDLSASYAKAVRDSLPGAMLVADRFHLVALANDMLT